MAFDPSLYENVTLDKLIARNPDNADYKKRVTMEFRIANKTIKALHDNGYDLGVDADDETMIKTNDRQPLIDMLFNLDDAYLIAYVGASRKGWIRFVFGNDGYDLICDYTTNLETVIAPINEYANKLETESR